MACPRCSSRVNCAPFLLSTVLQYHLSQHEKSNESTPSVQEVINLLRRSFYVDDCISSLDTAAEAQNFKAISTEVLKGAGMDLRKWQRSLEETTTEPVGHKVLGMEWDAATDTLGPPQPNERPQEAGWSRRSLLRYV